MDAEEFRQRWHGLYALQQYLIENVDLATADEVYDLLLDSAKLVRDEGGNVGHYIDSVCAAFPADEPTRAALREELWTKLSASP